MIPRPFKPRTLTARSYNRLCSPLCLALAGLPKLTSRGNRPLQMEFEDQLHALIFFHLQEHTSGRHLLQSLEEDTFAREHIAPKKGIAKSAFFEAMNERGLEQFLLLFEALQQQAVKVLPDKHPELGSLVAVDGSLIDAVLSMEWADYRKGAKKAKTHIGFDLNRGIPRKIFLTSGKDGERPFVDRILAPGETAVSDRGYQSHGDFDQLQAAGKHFVTRIKENTIKTCLESYPLAPGGMVFHDAKVLLGREGVNQTQTPLRLVGYRPRTPQSRCSRNTNWWRSTADFAGWPAAAPWMLTCRRMPWPTNSEIRSGASSRPKRSARPASPWCVACSPTGFSTTSGQPKA